MSEKKYLMSFTAGTLLLRESLTIAELLTSKNDWTEVKAMVLDQNLLQMRTLQASKRIFREVKPRLQCLTDEQRQLLLTSGRRDQNHLLWLAVCKRYQFIYDFAVTVIHEKYLRLDYQLTYDDYDIYFNNKAEWHPEVEKVADSTRYKQRQVVFKMLREAELLTADNQIVPVFLSPALIEVIAADDPRHFAIFPVSQTDIQEWAHE